MSGRAKFVFWWEGLGENGEAMPMFDVIENDRNLVNGSTVTGDALIERYGIPLPLFPDHKTWKRQVAEKRRCRFCPAHLRGLADLEHHQATAHRIAI